MVKHKVRLQCYFA